MFAYYAAIVVFVVSYILIATEKVHRVAAALGGVAAMTLLGLVRADTAFFNHHTGVDWNVLFLLFGMMVIVSILRHTGLFEFIALWAARTSGGNPARLMLLLILVTAAFSPILDNVTTVLLVTPVTLSVCQRLRIDPMPHLIALILTANIGGLSTLIADPPNIIIASRAELTFNDFLIQSLPLCLALLVILVLLLRVLFRRKLRVHVDVDEMLEGLHPGDAIEDRALLIRCLVVLGLTMVAFGLHTVIHVDPSIIALLGAGAMVLTSRTTPKEFLGEVEWMTLAFFMALFVLVGALVEVGVISSIGRVAADIMAGNELAGASGLLVFSAVVGAIVDNIPYTTAMTPVVAQMVASTGHAGAESPLWWAFIFGADLGGNTTAVAAGANVVVLGVAAKWGRPISFWRFTKYGLIVTAVTVAVAWLYVWLRYFVLGWV
ncbi:MAG: ArsB/NhaD family transporter [Propionibacteriaceae bacterium]|jgi:Na+/H+ antiporter NhaD/arsenite permease-like protein|nr:ArsB/NhaD family transporter [Propionibacteriaceae bacterium]